MNKLCTRCNKNKDLSQFSKRSSRCKLCKAEITRIWYAAHPERAKISRQTWAKKHPEETRTYKVKWALSHPEKNAMFKQVYRNNNKEKVSACGRRWRQKNKGKTNYYTRKYQADKLQRTPQWLTEDQLKKIEQFYINCPKGYHVDHIIPLRGENVSGLHVLENLQYLPALENIKKSNKFGR